MGDFWGTVVFLPFWLVLYLILLLIRRNVITPRVGIVKFGQWRVSRMMRFNIVMFILLTLSLILGILSFVQFDVAPGWIHTARFSLIFLLSFSVAGFFLDFARLYLYGVLIALAQIIGEVLFQYLHVPHHGFPVTFGFASGLITITGLVLLTRFVRMHPLQSDHYNQLEGIE
jgi:hypothetical protein